MDLSHLILIQVVAAEIKANSVLSVRFKTAIPSTAVLLLTCSDKDAVAALLPNPVSHGLGSSYAVFSAWRASDDCMRSTATRFHPTGGVVDRARDRSRCCRREGYHLCHLDLLTTLEPWPYGRRSLLCALARNHRSSVLLQRSRQRLVADHETTDVQDRDSVHDPNAICHNTKCRERWRTAP